MGITSHNMISLNTTSLNTISLNMTSRNMISQHTISTTIKRVVPIKNLLITKMVIIATITTSRTQDTRLKTRMIVVKEDTINQLRVAAITSITTSIITLRADIINLRRHTGVKIGLPQMARL